MKTSSRIALLLATAVGLLAPRRSRAGERDAKPAWIVIVNATNPAHEISEPTLAALFLKKQSSWNAITRVAVVEPGRSSAARQAFDAEVLKKSPAGLEAYWRQLIFSGRDVPPLEKSSDAAVVEFVRDHGDAIGIVSHNTQTSEVRVLTVGGTP